MQTRRGFTLIELMIVIAIIGVLAGIAIPHFSRARERARQGKCFENSSLLTRMTELYYIETKDYPTNPEDLAPSLVGQRMPFCPGGGVYQWVPYSGGGDVGKKVRCNIHNCATATFGG